MTTLTDQRKRYLHVGLLVLAGAAWLFFAAVAVPALIARAYNGASLSWINAIFAAHQEQPLGFFLGEWYGIAILGTIACLAVAGFARLLRSPAAPRLVGEATPEALGAIRVLVCGVLLLSTLWEDLPSTAAIPRELVRPMGILQVLYLLPIGFEQFAASATALGVFKGFTALALFLGMLGWKTRLILPLAAACYLIQAGLIRQYAWFYHTGLVPLYVLIVLSFAPSGDGWSLDRLRKLWKGAPVPPSDKPTAQYGWARYAVWTVFAMPYVAAGMSKLRNSGVSWVDAVNFKNNLLYCAVRPMEFDFNMSLLLAPAPDLFFTALAVSALLGELFYGLVLFSRWARFILPATMLLMHIGILLLQNILFFDLILLQCIFFNLNPLRAAVARRLNARKGWIEVFYRPDLDRHARMVRVLSALDLFERISFVETAAGSWRARYGGQEYRDAGLLRLMSRSLPALWWLLPLLYIPGVPALLVRKLDGHAKPRSQASAPSVTMVSAAGSPRLVLVIASLLLFCWTFRLEFFPFTGMQMFSKMRDSVITYEVAQARLSSGATMRAPIEEGIGAMSDSRYRRILENIIDAEDPEVYERFLRISMQRWNAEAPADQQVASVEVQRYIWDFVADPDSPTRGTLVAAHRVPVSPEPSPNPLDPAGHEAMAGR